MTHCPRKVLLFHLDGKLPNIALMRIAHHHRERGDSITILRPSSPAKIGLDLFDDPDVVYASAIFEKTRPMIEAVIETHPGSHVGGTGLNLTNKLSDIGIPDNGPLDYSIYTEFTPSIGFSQRGCRLRCKFCVVPKKEGKVAGVSSIAGIWRGDPHPRQIILLDNDFFGQVDWRDRIAEIRKGEFAVSFCQGINVRILDDEIAQAVASVNYRDSTFKVKRIYCAWDNAKDEGTVFRGLSRLRDAGINPDNIMVYMLIGYWPGETHADREYRRQRLREFGVRPYPMPFTRNRELVGFQRWIVGAYDKQILWEDWEKAHYQPRNLAIPEHSQPRLL